MHETGPSASLQGAGGGPESRDSFTIPTCKCHKSFYIIMPGRLIHSGFGV